MFNLWRRAVIYTSALALSGAIQAQTSLPQDNQATQPNTEAPKSAPRSAPPTAKQRSGDITSSEQDHVSGSLGSPDPNSKTNGMNRAVAAPHLTHPAHPAVHPKASPSPRAQKQPGSSGNRAPVESHSAIQQNPQLPIRMPPPPGTPSGPAPNQNPEQPQNH